MCVPIAALGLTAMQTLTAGTAIAATGISAMSAIQQGRAAQATARNNAQMAEYAAQDAQKRGEEEAAAIQRKGAALKSSQRVSLAAKGLDLGYGTAADLQDQTDFFTQSDAATARTNAGREAWTLRARGSNEMAQGNAARSNANLSAAGTLIGGAGKVASRWYGPSSSAVTSASDPVGNFYYRGRSGVGD